MKLDEFKAWFEGFTESMEGAPTKKQWERIKARVAEIDGVAVTYPVYVDRYWPYVKPLYTANPIWSGAVICGAAQGVGVSSGNVAMTAAASALPSSAQAFQSHSAMYAARKAEALQ